MIADHGFAYAQARLQARYAGLPTEADWGRLRAARSLSGWLEEARAGVLKPWVKGFSAQSDAHDIERGVRALFVESAQQAAEVMPRPWRDAVLWCRWLPLLGLFEHVRGGGAPPAWAARDYWLASILDDDGRFDATLAGAAGIAPLLADGDAGKVWVEQWRQRWPRCRRSDLRALAHISGLCAGHLRSFRQCPPAQAWSLRQALRERLRLQFHLDLLQPATVFILLALVALDLERLRRALLDRALFAADAPAIAAKAGRAA